MFGFAEHILTYIRMFGFAEYPWSSVSPKTNLLEQSDKKRFWQKPWSQPASGWLNTDQLGVSSVNNGFQKSPKEWRAPYGVLHSA